VAGFFSGTLLALYDDARRRGDGPAAAALLSAAIAKNEALALNQFNTGTHDVGFMVFTSLGHQWLLVAEKNIARVDNAFASWRRVIARAFGVEVKRGVWLAGYFADVRLGDDFEVARAEAWAKAAVDAGALRCSSEEPALPEALTTS
jgi:hypothetical protein